MISRLNVHRRLRRWLTMAYTRITVRLDGVQLAWVDALAELNDCPRAAVIRESISYYAARESARVARTRRYRLIGLIARAEQFDPIGEYLARPTVGAHSGP